MDEFEARRVVEFETKEHKPRSEAIRAKMIKRVPASKNTILVMDERVLFYMYDLLKKMKNVTSVSYGGCSDQLSFTCSRHQGEDYTTRFRVSDRLKAPTAMQDFRYHL